VDSPVDTQQPGCTDRASVGEDTCVQEAACTWTGSASKAFFGQAIAAGDVTGDGAMELVVGAPGTTVQLDTGSGYGAGRVHVLSGEGWVDQTAVLEGRSSSAYVGSAVAVVPDVDGDGVADILIGAMGEDVIGSASGAVYLVNGSGDQLARWTGLESYDRAGFEVHGGDDVDGDGIADLWVTGDFKAADDGLGPGAAYLLLGGQLVDGSLADADAVLQGNGQSSLGQAYASGDFDGDGYVDTMISAPYAEAYRGAVYRVPGGALPQALPDAWIEGVASSDAFGWRLAAGDFDGDGELDLAVGAPLNDQTDNAAGAVFVYTDDEVAVWTGEWMESQAGSGLGAGDLDGDGSDELFIGAVATWRGLATKSGRVYVVDGQGGALGDAPLQVHGNSSKDYLGHPITSADLDGDGAEDLLLGTAYANRDQAYDVGSVYLFFGQP